MTLEQGTVIVVGMSGTESHSRLATLPDINRSFVTQVETYAPRTLNQTGGGVIRIGECSLRQEVALDFIATSAEFVSDQPGDPLQEREDVMNFYYASHPIYSMGHVFGGARKDRAEFFVRVGRSKERIFFKDDERVARLLDRVVEATEIPAPCEQEKLRKYLERHGPRITRW